MYYASATSKFRRRGVVDDAKKSAITSSCNLQASAGIMHLSIEDVSINNEYEYENDYKPYSYSKSFTQLSMLAMTPSSSLQKIKLLDSA